MGVRMTRLKDPRLVAGVILIAASAVVGGTLLAGPPVIRVYRAVEAVIPGTPIADAGLEIAEVPPGVAGPYVTVGESGTVAEVLQPGELLARSSLSEADDAVALVLPVALPPASALTAGSNVEIWEVREEEGSEEPAARIVSDRAILVRQSEPTNVGAAGQVEVRVPTQDVPGTLRALGSSGKFVVIEASRGSEGASSSER